MVSGDCDGGEAAEAAWESEGDSRCGGDLVTLYRGLFHALPIQVGDLTRLRDIQNQSAEKTSASRLGVMGTGALYRPSIVIRHRSVFSRASSML